MKLGVDAGRYAFLAGAGWVRISTVASTLFGGGAVSISPMWESRSHKRGVGRSRPAPEDALELEGTSIRFPSLLLAKRTTYPKPCTRPAIRYCTSPPTNDLSAV